MKKNKNMTLGRKGEQDAAEFLEKKGYHILSKNFRTNLGEIDIIALENGEYVFIEVKARSSAAFGAPSEAVTLRKQKQICKCAMFYLASNKLLDKPARFDVVSVHYIDDGCFIEIIKNAFDLC